MAANTTVPPHNDDTKTLILALLENADRLGLKWAIRIATITTTGTATVKGRFDGDTEPVEMISLAGHVDAGMRVYVAAVPPSGNYIIGLVNSRLLPSAPRAQITRSNAQSIPNNVLTDVDFDTVNRDTDNMVDLPGDNSAITFTVDGDYQVGADATFASNGTGIRHMSLLIDGVTPVSYDSTPADAIGATGLSTVGTVTVTAGQKLTVQLRQNAGGPLNTSTFVLVTLWAHFVGPAHD